MPKRKPAADAPIVYEMDYLFEYTDAAILAEIRRVAKLAPDGPLTMVAFNRLARVTANTASYRFRGWGRALARAGIAERYCGFPGRLAAAYPGAGGLADAELLDEIRRVARERGLARVRQADMEAHSPVPFYIYRRRFGRWNEAVRLAGLEPGCRSAPHGAAELAGNLRAVWDKLGAPPRWADLSRPPSRIAATTYVERFGSYRRALAAFVAEANGGPPMASAMVNPPKRIPRAYGKRAPERPARGERKPAHLEWGIRYRRRHPLTPFRRRAVPLGLRYMVFERDRFRCTACGATPSDRPGCTLHIDHVVPVAKGGYTLLENLRTLCAECNRGKGARD